MKKKFKYIDITSKKSVVLLLLVSMIINISSCGKITVTKTDNKKDGEIESFDWSKYDKLIRECKSEADQKKRNKKMYEAENMLLDTGAVIPLVGAENQYLCREDIKDFFVSGVGTPIIKYAYNKNHKNELNAFISDEPDTFDSAKSSSMEAGTIVENYQGNLYCSTKDGVKKELASDLKISKDNLTYTIKINKDAKWSDGVDVTADDFVYTWKRAAKKENCADYGYMFEPIDGYPNNLNVKAVDNKTLKIKLKSHCPYFKQLFAHSCFSPVRKDMVESADGYKDKNGNVIDVFAWGNSVPKVTCGAFMVKSWKHNSSIVLKKNPKYIFADKIKVDTVNLMLSSDATSIYSAYKTGDIDIDTELAADEIANLKTRKDFYSKRYNEVLYLFFSIKSDFFRGMTANEACDFRKAVGYAIDRNFISSEVFMGENLEEGRIVSCMTKDGTGHKFSDSIKDFSSSPFRYDLKKNLTKARELLRNIGYTFDNKGKLTEEINLEYAYYESGNHKSVASCLQADLKELGINLTLKNVDRNIFNSERKKGNFDTARGRWVPDYDDPMTFLELFTTDNTLNCPQLGRLK